MVSPMNDATESQEAVFALLADPATHGGQALGGQAVKRIDTHAASVFLAGERVFKIKRAVRFPFLDYSTLAKRKAACETELAINRRTAPDIYRRVVAITREADGRLALDGRGEPVEWAVEMRRFDENLTLDHLAAAGKIDAALADALGRTVAASHADAAARRRRALDRGARKLHRRACRSLRPAARLVSGRSEPKRSRRPAALPSRASAPLLARARADGIHPPHPRRPASRQYRAARRPAGAVRRHRVQRGHRVRRRALRSRLPADGPGRARSRAGGERRRSTAISSNPSATRTSTRSRRCRSSCRCAPRSAPR